MPEEYGDLDHVVPADSDSPNVPKAFQDYDDSLTAELKAFPPGQIVTAGAGDEAKILVVQNTGAPAFKALSGDVTISAAGVAEIGAGKVGTTELADLGVTTGKVNNGAVTEGKLSEAVQAKLSDERTPKASSVNSSKIEDGTIADADLASPNNSSYRTIFSVYQMMRLDLVAGDYIMGTGNPPLTFEPTNVAAAPQVPILPITAADYEVPGKTTKLRLRATILTNGTKPGVTITLGIDPVTSVGSVPDAMELDFASPLAASVQIATAATEANSELQVASAAIDLPAGGLYIPILSTGTLANNAVVAVGLHVQINHV